MKKKELTINDWELILRYIANKKKEFLAKSWSKIYSFLYQEKREIIKLAEALKIDIWKDNNIQYISNLKIRNIWIFNRQSNFLLSLKITKETYGILTKYVNTMVKLKEIEDNIKQSLKKQLSIITFFVILIGVVSINMSISYLWFSSDVNIEMKTAQFIKTFWLTAISIIYMLFLGYFIIEFRKLFMSFEEMKIHLYATILFKINLLLVFADKIDFKWKRMYINYFSPKEIFWNILNIISSKITKESYFRIRSFIKSTNKRIKPSTNNVYLNADIYTYFRWILIAQNSNWKELNEIYNSLKWDIDTQAILLEKDSKKYIGKIDDFGLISNILLYWGFIFLIMWIIEPLLKATQ